MKHSLIFLLLLTTAFASPSVARSANTENDSCGQLGQTAMSDDQQNLLLCACTTPKCVQNNKTSDLKWKPLGAAASANCGLVQWSVSKDAARIVPGRPFVLPSQTCEITKSVPCNEHPIMSPDKCGVVVCPSESMEEQTIQMSSVGMNNALDSMKTTYQSVCIH
jgi:hypothetical protein